jgi:tetrapyrrole methylase family protein/MazG family protein
MKLDAFLKGSHALYIASELSDGMDFDKRIPLIVRFSGEMREKKKAADVLKNAYGSVSVFVFENESAEGAEIPVEKISEYGFEYLAVDKAELTKLKRFGFYDLVEIMRTLRAENGCEWDRAQTHESIRINLIEEAYELVEAIDCNDPAMMLEETGDVLMQAVFHTEIAKENGEFGFSDMITALCRKLIDRHTHIFGENHASNADEALVFWNEAKKKEKKYKSGADAMDRVPKNLPALLYAEKIQKIARKFGFDWESADGAVDKINEELNELLEADASRKIEEGGDLLFAAVNALRLMKIDPEMALHESNKKFLRRFKALEDKFASRGKDMNECSLEQLDEVWDEVKKEEKLH